MHIFRNIPLKPPKPANSDVPLSPPNWNKRPILAVDVISNPILLHKWTENPEDLRRKDKLQLRKFPVTLYQTKWDKCTKKSPVDKKWPKSRKILNLLLPDKDKCRLIFKKPNEYSIGRRSSRPAILVRFEATKRPFLNRFVYVFPYFVQKFNFQIFFLFFRIEKKMMDLTLRIRWRLRITTLLK